MDWTTILKAQQTDFIQRLKSGELLHCEKEGQHSELTVISGERLKQLRDFCWEMANKFKQQYDVKNIFFNNMKGKLGEEVVKIRLGDFVNEVDYEKYSSGDGKIDFTLTSDSSVGIQVKTRYGNCDQVQWTIDKEEIEKNAALIFILCQEEFSDTEKEYGLIIAGFLPTNMIKIAGSKTLVGIDELFYIGGLRGYLENFKSSTSYDSDKYIILGDECVNNKDYQGAIFDYYQFIHKIGRYIYEINASNDIKAPLGYFPGNAGGIWLDWGEDVDYEFVKGWFDDYLYRRVDICKMYNIKSEKIYEPLTKHNTQVSDDYKDNYPTEDLNNNDDYDDYFDDSYQEEYDDMYYSKDMQNLADYRSSDYGYLEDFDQSSFYDYFN